MTVKRFVLGESNSSTIKTLSKTPYSFELTVDKILKKMMDSTYEHLMEEGVGTAKNGGTKFNTPKGGVPVWQGDPSKTTYYPGALRDAHNKEEDGAMHKAITVNGYLFYAPAVINGHSRSPPNKYHERALNKTLKEDIPRKYVQKLMQDWVNGK